MTTSATQPSSRPMRADARRNYDALLSAAEEALALHGSETSLDEIARGAGVGIGTLYRHFPTRQDLIEAVYLRQMDGVRAAAEALLASHTPGEAFAEWLRRQMEFGRRGRCTAASVMASVMAKKKQEGTDINLAATQVRAAGTALLERAQQAGAVRADIDIGEVLRMVHAILIVTEEQPDREEQSARMLDVVIAGLRP